MKSKCVLCGHPGGAQLFTNLTQSAFKQILQNVRSQAEAEMTTEIPDESLYVSQSQIIEEER